ATRPPIPAATDNVTTTHEAAGWVTRTRRRPAPPGTSRASLGGLFGVPGVVGTGDELVEVAVVPGITDGHAETDRQRVGEAGGHVVEAAADPGFDAVDLGRLGQEDGELVAGEPADDVGVSASAPQRLGDQAQGPVTVAVAVAVVDAFEVVEIGEDGDDGPSGPDGFLDGVLGEEDERSPVVQPGELVDQGQLPQLGFEAAPFRHVPDDDAAPQCSGGVGEDLGGHVGGEGGPVGPPEGQLAPEGAGPGPLGDPFGPPGSVGRVHDPVPATPA